MGDKLKEAGFKEDGKGNFKYVQFYRQLPEQEPIHIHVSPIDRSDAPFFTYRGLFDENLRPKYRNEPEWFKDTIKKYLVFDSRRKLHLR